MSHGAVRFPCTELALPYCEKCSQQENLKLISLQKKIDSLRRILGDYYDQWATGRRSVAVQTVTPEQCHGNKRNDNTEMPARGYKPDGNTRRKYKLMRLQSEIEDLQKQLAASKAQVLELVNARGAPRRQIVNPDITEYIHKVSSRAARFELSIQRLHELVGVHKQDALRKTEEITLLRAQHEELLHHRAQHLRNIDCRILQVMLDNAQWLAGNLNLGEQAIRVANDRAVAFEVVSEVQNRLICELRGQIEPCNGMHPAQSGLQVAPITEVHRLEAQVRHLELLLADKGVTIGECNDEQLHICNLPQNRQL